MLALAELGYALAGGHGLDDRRIHLGALGPHEALPATMGRADTRHRGKSAERSNVDSRVNLAQRFFRRLFFLALVFLLLFALGLRLLFGSNRDVLALSFLARHPLKVTDPLVFGLLLAAFAHVANVVSPVVLRLGNEKGKGLDRVGDGELDQVEPQVEAERGNSSVSLRIATRREKKNGPDELLHRDGRVPHHRCGTLVRTRVELRAVLERLIARRNTGRPHGTVEEDPVCEDDQGTSQG